MELSLSQCINTSSVDASRYVPIELLDGRYILTTFNYTLYFSKNSDSIDYLYHSKDVDLHSPYLTTDLWVVEQLA